MYQQPWPLNASNSLLIPTVLGQDAENEAEVNLPVRSKLEQPVSSYQTGTIVKNEDGESSTVSPPRPAFEFVDVGTLSRVEKERDRARIRSRAAMKIFRQESYSEQSNARKKKTKDPGGLGKEAKHVRRINEFPTTSYESTVLTKTPGLGRRDPFRQYPTDQVLPYADFLFDHSTNVLWPALLPTIIKGQGGSFGSSWLERALAHPLAMEGLMYGAMSHFNFLRTRNNVSAVDVSRRLHHKVQTIRLVNEELQSPTLENIDDVLLGVLALSTNEAESAPAGHVIGHTPFHPPFADAQWISVYGSVVQNKAHVAGMVALVKMRGGLDEIKWPGLAAIISYGDIIGATQDFRHPYFPLPISALPPNSAPSTSYLHSSTAPDLGVAFSTDLLRSQGIPPAFFTTILTLIDYTLLLETWSQGLVAVPTIFELTSRRNATQHALLSLPQVVEGTDPEGTVFYENVRLGAMLFSLAVVFPLPPTTGVFQKMVLRLQSAILAVSSGNSLNSTSKGVSLKGWVGLERTLFWLCTLGGVASEGMVERSLFVDIVRDLSRKLGLKTWRQAVLELKRYLWLDVACDCGGREFWAEVVGRERSLSSDTSGMSDGRSI